MLSFKVAILLSTALAPFTLAQTKIRYMPFGDSITEFGCWRAQLYDKLVKNNYTNVDFVGSQTSTTACQGLTYDKNHEGHAGFQAVNIANQNQLVGWLKSNPADVITMHLGTNDIAARRTNDQMLAAFTTLVKQMRDSNPKMKIIVAQIIPLPSSDAAVKSLNAAIPAWLKTQNSTDSPIWLVDQYSNFSASDLGDGVHPNASGDVKMMNKWYPAVAEALDQLLKTPTTPA